ncbi:PH domain-containing protein [Micrococcus porci]|uniref:PH domain-containing protein n=1 Tax=Micrococcus porci TaxID=2856555 RepID=UPI001CCE3163|nr:PH domain-containing protein [Micrococcus porci]UBH24451.1 PH domain-containing protein [Micrococcus porci]
MRLEPGEQVVVRTRSHPRVLVGTAARLTGTAFLLGLAMGLLARPGLPSPLRAAVPWLEAVVWAAAVVAVLVGVVRPLLRWATRATVLTSERLVQRPGLGAGPEAAMPLVSIADVQRRRRGASSGDLHILFQDPLRQVYWRLADVPEAERFEQVLAETTRAARDRARPAMPAWGGVL